MLLIVHSPTSDLRSKNDFNMVLNVRMQRTNYKNFGSPMCGSFWRAFTLNGKASKQTNITPGLLKMMRWVIIASFGIFGYSAIKITPQSKFMIDKCRQIQ